MGFKGTFLKLSLKLELFYDLFLLHVAFLTSQQREKMAGIQTPDSNKCTNKQKNQQSLYF